MNLTRHGAYLFVGPAAVLIWTAVFVALRSRRTSAAVPSARIRTRRRRLTAVGTTLAIVVVAMVQPVLPAWANPFSSVRNNGASSFDAYAWKSYETTVKNDPPAAYWWRLAEPGATTYAGAMLGGVNGDYRSGHTTVASPITGAGLTAANLNGSNQCLDFTNIMDASGRAAFSAEFWFYRSASINGRTQRLLGTLSGANDWAMAINPPDHANVNDRNSIYFMRNGIYTGSGAPTSEDAWHHVVGTYDGTNMAFYLDGVMIGSPVASTGNLVADPDPLIFGCRMQSPGSWGTSADHFQGAVAEVSLYNVALTARQVRSHYYASTANGAP